ncbi:MAG TPA: hypothetical protein VFU31_00510 [Candidatus Binatia bacterium]|nr:hypothetical protein [Candidatus Binatia bacterium]
MHELKTNEPAGSAVRSIGIVQRRRYINPDFLRDHAAKPLAIRSVEYVDDKCVVEVARMAGSGECWLPDKYSYEAHEIPEADVAQAWKPLNAKLRDAGESGVEQH